MKYLVRVKANHDCWLSDGAAGDPARTLVKSSAKRYKTKKLAHAAKTAMEILFPFRSYSIERE